MILIRGCRLPPVAGGSAMVSQAAYLGVDFINKAIIMISDT
jgi:hypothetical protein